MPSLELEQDLHRQGYRWVAGIDDAGRGPLAGPVVAGAVVISLAATEALDPDFLPGGSGQDAWFYHQLNGLADFGDGDLTVTLVASIAASSVSWVVSTTGTASPGSRPRCKMASMDTW